MADITRELAAITAAVLGEQVRGSIHDAIWKINDVSEKQLDAGTAIHADDAAGGYYEKSLYINTDTDELLRCNGTKWIAVSNIRGNGISSITGPEPGDTVLDDVYTIHYTDGEELEFVIHNGRGIVSVTRQSQDGLVDTYRILYNDGDYDDFEIKNGNQWYYGTLVSGEISADTGFTLPFECRPGDAYLNIAEDSIYTCKTGAAANATSTWNYRFTITSSSTGTNQYPMLRNLPNINGVELMGNKLTHELGLVDDTDLDKWLMDTTQTPEVPLEIPMAVDSTSFTLTPAQMAAASGYAIKVFFQVPDNKVAPSLKKVIHKDTGALEVYYTKVKSEQNPCKCKIRLVK